jgi:cyanate permease
MSRMVQYDTTPTTANQVQNNLNMLVLLVICLSMAGLCGFVWLNERISSIEAKAHVIEQKK